MRYLSLGYYITFWFDFFPHLLFHLLPQRLSVTAARKQFSAPAECKRSNKRRENKGWRGRTVRDVSYELPNQESASSSSNTGEPQHTVQKGEVFCLVSAAGGCTLPAYNSAWLDYPFYSGLKTACKFFYHAFLVYWSLCFLLPTSVFQTHYFHVIRFI